MNQLIKWSCGEGGTAVIMAVWNFASQSEIGSLNAFGTDASVVRKIKGPALKDKAFCKNNKE